MSHGLVLGKFMPPHLGHQYLVDFARAYADEVTVVVGSLASEPIDGALRHAWMSQLHPHCRVVHLTDENPQYPEEHPDFWAIWRASLARVVGRPIDYVFASENYGARLAQEMQATFIPTAGLREHLSISATRIRQNPHAEWAWIPAPVRAYYLRRISIFGPESTGKSTLAARLAEHFSTVWVPEYARTWLELGESGRRPTAADMAVIFRGQKAAERALAPMARRFLFCDTDPLVTRLWSEILCGEVAAELLEPPADPYALTLLLDADVPWREDGVRYLPAEGRAFFKRCRDLLERADRPYRVISGNWSERWDQAISAVTNLV